jgi:hypothetical protein
VEKLDAAFLYTKKKYDKGGCPLAEIGRFTIMCLVFLSKYKRQTLGVHEKKNYFAFSGEKLSRPICESLFLDEKAFVTLWARLEKGIVPDKRIIVLTGNEVNQALYTAVISYAAIIDLVNPDARKRPGTWFEVLLGSVLGSVFQGYVRTKHIPLPNPDAEELATLDKEAEVLEEGVEAAGEKEEEAQGLSVSTDIVLAPTDGKGIHIVIPAKITTRERVVQPFAHQLILDAVFKDSGRKYCSILMSVNEVQLVVKKKTLNSICVPGTIKLFQNHVAKLTALSYLDIPSRYLKEDLTSVIPVLSIGEMLASGYFAQLTASNKSS